MPEHEDAHFTLHNPIKEMVAKDPQAGATKVVLEEAEPRRIGGNPVLGRLDLGKEPVAQLAAALAIKIGEGEPDIGLHGPVETEIHRPSPRRSCSHVIEAAGSRSISSSRRRASATPSSSSSRIGGRLSSKSAANSVFSLMDKTLACCRIS
jgi:hypothetical protein